MTCQHTLFAPDETPAFLSPADGSPVVLFQPVLDTFAHRVLAHECVVRTAEPVEPARVQMCAMRSAAAQNPDGLYLIPLSPTAIDDPPGTVLPPANLIFDVGESDLMADPRRWLKIRDNLRTRGFSFALSGAGPESFPNLHDFAPEYIRIDKRLVRSIDRPDCGATVSKLVRLAEDSGAHLIATGVDRRRMLENLWLLGIQFMQGDLFGHPSPRVI